jgi:hypothetical protein
MLQIDSQLFCRLVTSSLFYASLGRSKMVTMDRVSVVWFNSGEMWMT